MKITRRFTKSGHDAFASVEYEKRTSRITNSDGSVVFEMNEAEIPRNWSQLATDIMVSKYFRKAGVPQTDAQGNAVRDAQGNIVTGPEKSVRQVINRLAGCWRHWGETHGYFDSADDAQAFYDELVYMLLHQMGAPNSPQWFNTGLNFAYGITGPSQGHYYCDPQSGQMMKSNDAYTHPQPHACFIQSVSDDLVNPGGIMDLWTREARLFKYGSGTGSNFSRLRGDNEPLSGGGKSSGLMSFLKIGDRAAGAIKSGGTTRRAAKMVCLDLDHPDIEAFVNWKVREEIKVAAMAEGLKVLGSQLQETAKKLGLKLDYDFNGEGYATVSGQNSNNSVRISNRFFKALEEDGDWKLYWRTNTKVAKTIKARDLWEQIAYAAWRCADPGVQYDDTINQWHTCPQSGRINASNPCVTADTRVLTPGGIWRRIDQMIHIPSRLVTNLAGHEIHVCDGAFPTGTKEIYELRTAGGYSLKLTGDHKVWTRGRGWVAARQLLPQDEVKLPSRPACVHEIGEPRDAFFFQMLGLFLSDANDSASCVNLEACLASELIDGFAHYAAEAWKSVDGSYPDDYANAAAHQEVCAHGDGSVILTLRLANRRLISRLGAYQHVEAGQRRLSDDAFTSGLAAQKHLLRALFSADGRMVDHSLEIRGQSRGLLEDLQLLLLGFGVQASILPPGDCGRPGLRIEPDSLRSFAALIGLLPGAKLRDLTAAAAGTATRDQTSGNFDRFASLVPLGAQYVFDLSEPVTHSFIANGLTIHNCSEYMFLDDTACNLASLNILTFFDAEQKQFDIEAFKHAVRIWTMVLEISVLMASFPSEPIARLSYRYRTLGLGYANIGAMLMQAGIPYDSDRGRAICAAITAVLTGEAYATSAEMARELGAFTGLADNKEAMLRVIRNHRRAAYGHEEDVATHKSVGDYEQLDIKPVAIDPGQFSATDPLATRQLLHGARDCWDRALAMGERHGYRNAQVTAIAPTGTIGLLMDCDTTGVEPDFALVKFKKLSGGGCFKIANQSLRPALVNLGYSSAEIHDILAYVMGTLTLDNAPHVNRDSLKLLGFSDEDLNHLEDILPGVFELSDALSAKSLGAKTMARLKIPAHEWQAPSFNLLQRLGFSRKQITEANDVICGRGTIEGAPLIQDEHLSVFDCANRCGRYGKRFISVEGHIRMMAAAQSFISGAISKTINLPSEATIPQIKQSYMLSWKLGLKATALYRDGSKLSQPLNSTTDQDPDKAEADDEENVQAAREEVAGDVAKAAVQVSAPPAAVTAKSDNLAAPPPHQIEKIIERIVERPLRRRLPDTRRALTHKFDVAGHEGYITVGLYEDGQPGEVFITMAKEGSTIGGLMDTVATLVSVALQYGVPVESLVRKFEHVRFEPSGMTRNREIPIAKSLVDYIFRWLAMEFIPGYRAANAPKRSDTAAPAATAPAPAEAATATCAADANAHGPATGPAPEAGSSRVQGDRPASRGGNGHGPRHDPDTAKAFDYTGGQDHAQAHSIPSVEPGPGALNLRLAIVADPLSQFGSQLQADAPACDVCGSITVRSGTCYKCLNCGNSMGCS